MVVGADDRENGWIGEALAEHAAISRSSLARGLTQVNTDVVSVGTRYVGRLRGAKMSFVEYEQGENVRSRRDIQYYLQDSCRRSLVSSGLLYPRLT